MNDRFKFRVWSKNYNEYLTGSLVSTLLYFGYRDDFYIEFNSFSTFADDLIIEQCIGLKDKNGNLIYENDVVQYWWNQKTNTGTIFWNNEFARFCIANNETHCPEDSNCLMFVADKKIIEIIGNVHEQAEQKDIK